MFYRIKIINICLIPNQLFIKKNLFLFKMLSISTNKFFDIF
jgi:hypothetical protein